MLGLDGIEGSRDETLSRIPEREGRGTDGIEARSLSIDKSGTLLAIAALSLSPMLGP